MDSAAAAAAPSVWGAFFLGRRGDFVIAQRGRRGARGGGRGGGAEANDDDFLYRRRMGRAGPSRGRDR